MTDALHFLSVESACVARGTVEACKLRSAWVQSPILHKFFRTSHDLEASLTRQSPSDASHAFLMNSRVKLVKTRRPTSLETCTGSRLPRSDLYGGIGRPDCARVLFLHAFITFSPSSISSRYYTVPFVTAASSPSFVSAGRANIFCLPYTTPLDETSVYLQIKLTCGKPLRILSILLW